MDIRELSDGIVKLSKEATTFFDVALLDCDEEPIYYRIDSAERRNAYWDKLTNANRQLSQMAQETLLNVISLFIPTLKASPLLDKSDEMDVGRCVKRMRAALKLRKFTSWDIEVLHDEGTVLGVNPPGQSENEYSSPDDARNVFFECIEQLQEIIQLLKITPTNIPDGLPAKNPNLSHS